MFSALEASFDKIKWTEKNTDQKEGLDCVK